MRRLATLALATLLSGCTFACTVESVAAQERTIAQSGLEHNFAKPAYSLAAYTLLREAGVSKPVSTVLATVGVWGAGWAIQASKGHRITLIDKTHDLAAHAIVTVPLSLRGKPRIALGSLLTFAATIAVTCSRANPRSC